MKKLLIALTTSGLLTACSDPNIEISVYEREDPLFGIRYELLKIKALEDDVTIEEVVANRGDCRLQKVDLPLTLAFGRSANINAYNCDVVEVEVTTDGGTWTETYDDYE
jgi:hypothetical protein